jgi:hypothetical protein
MLVLMADQLVMMMMVVVVVVHKRSNPENWRLWDCNHNTSSNIAEGGFEHLVITISNGIHHKPIHLSWALFNLICSFF